MSAPVPPLGCSCDAGEEFDGDEEEPSAVANNDGFSFRFCFFVVSLRPSARLLVVGSGPGGADEEERDGG
jgi:hypothetical protein